MKDVTFMVRQEFNIVVGSASVPFLNGPQINASTLKAFIGDKWRDTLYPLIKAQIIFLIAGDMADLEKE